MLEPTPAGAPPSLQPFMGLGFSRTLIAPCLLICFLHLSRPGGQDLGWVWLEASCLEASKLEPAGPAPTKRVHGLDLGLARGL